MFHGLALVRYAVAVAVLTDAIGDVALVGRAIAVAIIRGKATAVHIARRWTDRTQVSDRIVAAGDVALIKLAGAVATRNCIEAAGNVAHIKQAGAVAIGDLKGPEGRPIV